MQQAQKKYFPGAGKFDKINSTYHCIIYFQPTQKRPFIDGYSKGLTVNESPDKIYVLQAWIERLLHKGYFDHRRVVKIDFFLQSFLVNSEEHLFTLTPTSYKIHSQQFITNERMNSFFVRMYKSIKEGKVDTASLKDKPQSRDEQSVFALRGDRFKSVEQLTAFCIQQIKSGKHSEERVNGFLRKYIEMFL